MIVTKLSPEGKEYYKTIVCEELWLRYFNSTAFDAGLITEDEHRKMLVKIIERTGQKKKELERCERQRRST